MSYSSDTVLNAHEGLGRHCHQPLKVQYCECVAFQAFPAHWKGSTIASMNVTYRGHALEHPRHAKVSSRSPACAWRTDSVMAEKPKAVKKCTAMLLCGFLGALHAA